jgi:hypothetical protein
MKNKIIHSKFLYFAFVILFVTAALLFINSHNSGDSDKFEKQAKVETEMPKNQKMGSNSHDIAPEEAVKGESLTSDKNNDNHFMPEKENFSSQLNLENDEKAESIVAGVGLSEKELRALHRSQRQKIQQMNRDMDSIVIVPSDEGDAAVTLGELLALHKQQKRAIENTQDFDEIVIASSAEDHPALTRRELTERHKQQRLAMENAQDWDQIVIPESEDGEPARTWDEVAALQELQDDGILESAEDPDAPAAPSSEHGGPDMTVHELKSLHMKQLIN